MFFDNPGVHTAHCCKWHGCKYGDKDCPVALGKLEQEYPCEWCSDELEEERSYREALTRIEEIKAWWTAKKETK